MVTSKPKGAKQFDPWAWIEPFDVNVWYMLIITTAVTGIIYFLMERLDPHSDKRRLHKSPVEATFLVAVNLTQHFEFQPRTHPARLLSFSASVFALVIGASYTANLASFLVNANQPSHSINSLDDAVRGNLQLCVSRSTQSDLAVSSAFPLARITRVDGLQGDVIQAVSDGLCDVGVTTVAAWNELQRNKTLTGGCRLEWRGRAFQNVPAGITTKADSGRFCTSLLRDVVNVYMSEMKADGFLNDAWERHLQVTTTDECVDSDSAIQDPESSQLTMNNMGGIFIFHFILTGTALIIALLIKCRRRMRKQKSNDTNVDDKPSVTFVGRQSFSDHWEESGPVVEKNIHNDHNHHHPPQQRRTSVMERRSTLLHSMKEAADAVADGMSINSQLSDMELEEIRNEMKVMSRMHSEQLDEINEKIELLMAAVIQNGIRATTTTTTIRNTPPPLPPSEVQNRSSSIMKGTYD